MKNQYIPDRNEIVWMDFDPAKGKEIGKCRPALVLSSKNYNKNMEILICCPISTSIRGYMTEIPIHNLNQPSVVVANAVRSMSWKVRKAKFITHAEEGVMSSVLQRLIPLIGADKILLEFAGISR